MTGTRGPKSHPLKAEIVREALAEEARGRLRTNVVGDLAQQHDIGESTIWTWLSTDHPIYSRRKSRAVVPADTSQDKRCPLTGVEKANRLQAMLGITELAPIAAARRLCATYQGTPEEFVAAWEEEYCVEHSPETSAQRALMEREYFAEQVRQEDAPKQHAEESYTADLEEAYDDAVDELGRLRLASQELEAGRIEYKDSYIQTLDQLEEVELERDELKEQLRVMTALVANTM